MVDCSALEVEGQGIDGPIQEVSMPNMERRGILAMDVKEDQGFWVRFVALIPCKVMRQPTRN